MSAGTKRLKSSKQAAKEPERRRPDGTGAFDFVHFFSNDKVRREYTEMVAFVLVLVCFLRLFGAEAYVIPTGSMATTLLGAHKDAVCPQCGHYTTVNASDESERGHVVTGALCQNCLQELRFGKGGYFSGDRILADKLVYEARDPRRWEVAVFKYPNGVDQSNHSARTNYIKRVVGLPGETLGIEFGDIFTRKNGDGQFTIERKPARAVMGTRRLVYDNDLPARDDAERKVPPRWWIEGGTSASQEYRSSFQLTGKPEEWLTYRHILRPFAQGAESKPSLILDYEAYDSGSLRGAAPSNLGSHWVGDLMIECDVQPESSEGEIVLELVEAHRVFHCVFNMKEGKVHLDAGETKASRPNPLRVGRSSQVRFANVDDQLIVWVDGSVIFGDEQGDGLPIDPPKAADRGPSGADLRPVRIGTKGGAATISSLKLYRDIYYSRALQWFPPEQDWREPSVPAWPLDPNNVDEVGKLVNRGGMRTFTLGDAQFFPLGDNSQASSDAREWKTQVVDRHLLLGRAVVRYWPVIGWEGGWLPVLRWKFVE